MHSGYIRERANCILSSLHWLQNIFLSVFLVVGYLSGGAYAAHVAVGWNHIHDDSHAGGIETVVGSLAAGAVRLMQT